jgi:hypothetical protein
MQAALLASARRLLLPLLLLRVEASKACLRHRLQVRPMRFQGLKALLQRQPQAMCCPPCSPLCLST